MERIPLASIPPTTDKGMTGMSGGGQKKANGGKSGEEKWWCVKRYLWKGGEPFFVLARGEVWEIGRGNRQAGKGEKVQAVMLSKNVAV